MAKAIGPYSPVVRVGHWVICSGQLGLVDGSLIEGGVAQQATQAIKNLASLLESEGSDLADVVKTTVFLTDMTDFATMNEVYVAGFGDSRPARSAVVVAGLPMGALFEIEAWAHTAHPQTNTAS
ncbi:MAG: Rid family detoxifying hydrolase [Acidimicrobiales bacterium]|jgi:2-iminobutanoate/2-iminopropanoate deaminase